MDLLLLAASTPAETAKGLSEAGIVAILVFFAILFMSAIAWLARVLRKQAADQQTHYKELLKSQETKFDDRLKHQQERDDIHKRELVEILEKALEKSARTEAVLENASRVLEKALQEQQGHQG